MKWFLAHNQTESKNSTQIQMLSLYYRRGKIVYPKRVRWLAKCWRHSKINPLIFNQIFTWMEMTWKGQSHFSRRRGRFNKRSRIQVGMRIPVVSLWVKQIMLNMNLRIFVRIWNSLEKSFQFATNTFGGVVSSFFIIKTVDSKITNYTGLFS